jgi:hypothetical protein
MKDKTADLLYNLAPLILIVVFSWFFSFLGSRLKKKTEDEPQPAKEQPVKAPFDIFLNQDEFPESSRPLPAKTEGVVPVSAQQLQAAQQRYTGPVVTSKPIKPKWWGA